MKKEYWIYLICIILYIFYLLTELTEKDKMREETAINIFKDIIPIFVILTVFGFLMNYVLALGRVKI